VVDQQSIAVPTATPLAETPLAINEYALAKELSVSVAWLRKDRRIGRTIPFYRIGKCVRYNLDRVRESLAAVEEGGAYGARARGVSKRAAATQRNS